MKWIRFVIPLVLSVVATTAFGQWVAKSSRTVYADSGGSSWASTARLNRMIVAEEPAPVAVGEETIVQSEPGVPCHDCSSPGWLGHLSGWRGHGCKARQTCCAARPCSSACGSCIEESTCGVCGSGLGVRPTWLHGCSACRTPLFAGLGKGSWPWSSSCGCQGESMPADAVLVPQPEAQGEPIENPRSLKERPRPATAEPAAKSASRGWSWTLPTWNVSNVTAKPAAPKPATRSFPPYEVYRAR